MATHVTLKAATRARRPAAPASIPILAALAAQVTAAPTTGEPRPPVPHPSPAALVALARVHLEHNELREAPSRLKQADTALGVTPDKLIQQAPHGPGRSMSSAPAGGREPRISSRRRLPATLVTRSPHRLLPAVKALRAAAAASRLGRA